MLTAPAFRRRIAFRACAFSSGQRNYAQGKRARESDEKRSASGNESGRKDKDKAVREGIKGSVPSPSNAKQKAATPSLIEQLFPERYAAGGTHREEVREVPKVPTERFEPPPVEPRVQTQDERDTPNRAEMLRREMQAQPPVTSVLVLRSAGKNLTEEDFRRVIPQGKHLEGWTLEQGDILRAIPGRDLETLEQTGYYYLLFSSPLSAFTYQGHVIRIHRMVAANAPSSLLSPIAPPQGYMLQGMDAHEAINSFSLIPPDQRLQLRQLKPPLPPIVHSLVKFGGYEPLMTRDNRMPFEARLTLEGPQLQLPAIRHILRTSGRDRGLSWSGDEADVPKLSQWQPVTEVPSPSDNSVSARRWERTREVDAEKEQSPLASPIKGTEDAFGDISGDDRSLKRRTPRPIYIAGFLTEQALQSFIHFWHGRPMTWAGAGKAGGDEEGDMPPVTHVEVLW